MISKIPVIPPQIIKKEAGIKTKFPNKNKPEN